jgi:hypothetical protein
MNATYPFQKSLRCTATSKRTRESCKAPAVTAWTVCRFHGARGGAPTGKRNGIYRHGLYTKKAAALNARLSDLQRQSRALLRRLVH